MFLSEARRFVFRNRVLALSCMCVLGVGLGVSALVFACLQALTSPELPGMRGMVYATIAEAAQGGGSERIDWTRYERIRASLPPKLRLAAYSRATSLRAHASGKEVNLNIAGVSRGFWGAFTPSLAAGRDFYTHEEVACQPRALILSYPSAKRLFASPTSAIGQEMVLNGQSYEIVGIGPPSFTGIFERPVDGWVPPSCMLSLSVINPEPEQTQLWRKIAWFYTIAGEPLLPSADLVKTINKNLPVPDSTEAPLHVTAGLTIDPVRDGQLSRWLRLGLSFALAFTLMTGLNYTILLLAQAPSQIADIRLKIALGAGPGRLFMDLIAGPCAVVAFGLVFSWVICICGLVILPSLFVVAKDICAAALPHAVVACGIAAAIACALTVLIAFAPALSVLQRSKSRLSDGHTTTENRSTVLLLDSVVTIQIVVCAVMAVVAGMITASAVYLLRTPLGFDATRVSVISLGPENPEESLQVVINTARADESSFPSPGAIRGVLHELGRLPGVRSVGYSESVPLMAPLSTVSAQLAADATKTYTVGTSIVTQGYFDAMGIRLLQGRAFSNDHSASANVVVINNALALELSPQESPVGKTIRIINPAASGLPSFSRMATIIGVVNDVKQNGPASSPEPTVYWSAFGSYFFYSSPYFVLDGIEPDYVLQRDIAKTVSTLIPGLTVKEVFSLRNQVRESMLPEAERAGAVMALAIVISSLAFLGMGGSLAFYVATRRRDLAIRMCFGATPWRIRTIVIRRAVVRGGIASLLSSLTWPFLAQLSSSEYLGSISWSYSRAGAYSLICFLLVVALSLIPANTATRAPLFQLLKDY